MPSQAFLSEDRPYSCADVLGVTGVSRNALFNYERHGSASATWPRLRLTTCMPCAR